MSISIYLYRTLFIVVMSIRLSCVSQIGGLKNSPKTYHAVGNSEKNYLDTNCTKLRLQIKL